MRSNSLSKGCSQTGRTQNLLVNSSIRAACGQLAVDDHRRDGTHAERFGALGHLAIMHVEHDHVAGRAGRRLHGINGFFAGRTASAEHFYLPLGRHFSFSFGQVDQDIASIDWAEPHGTLNLGVSSKVKAAKCGPDLRVSIRRQRRSIDPGRSAR